MTDDLQALRAALLTDLPAPDPARRAADIAAAQARFDAARPPAPTGATVHPLRPRRFWAGAAGGLLAAGLATFLILPQEPPVTDQMADAPAALTEAAPIAAKRALGAADAPQPGELAVATAMMAAAPPDPAAAVAQIAASLAAGALPAPGTVDVATLIGAVRYDYPPGDPTLHLLPAPWAPARQLLVAGIAAGPDGLASQVLDVETDGAPAERIGGLPGRFETGPLAPDAQATAIFEVPGDAAVTRLTLSGRALPLPAEDAASTDDAAFAAALAGFGLLLDQPDRWADWGFADALSLAEKAAGTPPPDDRAALIALMRQAAALSR